MKDYVRQPLVIVTWGFLLLFAILRWGPTVPFSVTTQERGEPFVATGTGTATEVPDLAMLSLGINEQGSSLATAQASANKKSQTLVDSIKKLGVEDRDIKTTSYNVTPNYDYKTNSRNISGYSISINYSVKVRDLDKVNDVLNEATAQGANNIGGISLGFSDEKKDSLLEKARIDAIAEAKKKGESLASLSGLSLGRILNVSEGYNSVPYLNRTTSFEASADMGQAMPEAAIEPGESEISTTVSITWEVR